MSQTVIMDDGSIHSFPDEATPEMMHAALHPNPDTMGPLTIPQTEAGYMLNSVNGLPGANLLKYAGAAMRGAGAAATGGDFSEEYNKSRENQEKLLYNEQQQFPGPNTLGRAGAGLVGAGVLPTAGATGTILGDAVVGGGEGFGYGALSGLGTGNNLNEKLSNALSTGVSGAQLGTLLSGAGGSLNSVVGGLKGLYPQARLDAAQMAVDEGIPVFKNNLSDSKALGYLSTASNEIPSLVGGTSGRVPAQQAAMAAALNKRIGQTGDEISQVNIHDALGDAGSKIGAINGKYDVPFQVQMNNNLSLLQQQAKQQLTGDNLTLFNKQIANLKADASRNNGMLPGDVYQQTRTGLNEDIQANQYGSTAKYAQLLRNARDVLDDAFAARATPEDAAALQTARQQYGNAKDLEPLFDKYPLGDYPMGALNAKVVDNPNLAPLGNVGQLMKSNVGNSGTAQRELLQKLGAGLGGLAGSAYGLHEVDPDWGDDAMMLGGAVVGPGLANRSLNPRVTNYSLNGLDAVQGVTPQVQALARMLRQAPAAIPGALSLQQNQGDN